MQVCSLAGIIAGIWVASRYGAEVGAWLKLDETISAAGGFVVVLLGGRPAGSHRRTAGTQVVPLCGVRDSRYRTGHRRIRFEIHAAAERPVFGVRHAERGLHPDRGPYDREIKKLQTRHAPLRAYFPVPGMGRRTGAAAGAGAGRRIADGKTVHRRGDTRHRELVRGAARRGSRPLPHPRAPASERHPVDQPGGGGRPGHLRVRRRGATTSSATSVPAATM